MIRPIAHAAPDDLKIVRALLAADPWSGVKLEFSAAAAYFGYVLAVACD
jgi:hypothetical protein